MNKIYDEKTLLITGGSRGIGAAISEIFAKNGCNIAINYLEDNKQASLIYNKLKKEYNIKVKLYKGDVSKENFVKKMVADVIRDFGQIDFLVNNAGISIDTIIEEKTVDNFKRILDVNLIGTFLMSKYVGQEMVKQKEGAIINISSTNGIDSYYPFSMDYDASKAGVINLTHNFANLYAPYINVNSIAPGWVMTDALKNMDEELIENECTKILLGRFAKPYEIAELVYHVANNKYINDSIIKIDGGRKC